MSRAKKLFYPLYGLTVVLLSVVFLYIYIPMYEKSRMHYFSSIYCEVFTLLAFVIFGIEFGLYNLLKVKRLNISLRLSLVNLITLLISISLATYATYNFFQTGKYFDAYFFWTILAGFLLLNIRTEKRGLIFSILFSLIALLIPCGLSFYVNWSFRRSILLKFSLNDPVNLCIYFVLGAVLAVYTLYPEFIKQGKWTVNISPMIVGVVILLLSIVYFIVCCLFNLKFGWTYYNCVSFSSYLMLSSLTKKAPNV